MLNYEYLTKEHLKGFNSYKVIPTFVAPNLLTFLGFLCMVAVVLFMYVYDYQFYAVGGRPGESAVVGQCGIPDWVFMTCGVLVFLAYNLDGVDGKQARRIGMSGPLGELFDHGLDSYILFFMYCSVLSLFGRDAEFSLPCFRSFLMVLSATLNLYVMHFEKYNTGTLYSPWGYDLSMWVTFFLYIGAGVYGPQIYKVYFIGSLTFVQSFEILVHFVGAFSTLPMAVYNIHMSYKRRTGQMHSFTEAARPVWSLLTITVAVLYWAQFSHNDIIEYDPRAFIFLYGSLFSNIATRLIIAELSHQRCELVNWFLWPLLGGIVVSLTLPQLEVTILYTLTITAFLAHVHYGVCVVRQICEYLKISCFTVPKKSSL